MIFLRYFLRNICFSITFVVEMATDASILATENWGLNMEICDFINSTAEGFVPIFLSTHFFRILIF